MIYLIPAGLETQRIKMLILFSGHFCLTKQKQQNERQPKHHAQLLYMSHHIIIATIIITKIMNEAF